MTRETDDTLKKESAREGRRIFLYIITFFVTFMAVDAFFVYKALSTHKGVVVENAYEIGLHYNDIIAKAREDDNPDEPEHK